MKNILIIGGGISGLIAANHLATGGCKVLLIEKHTYPRHKVCGEYLSMEVYEYLMNKNFLPLDIHFPVIKKLLLTSEKGREVEIPLPLGGIGISRFILEDYLKNCAIKNGVEILFDEVTEIKSNSCSVSTKKSGDLSADILLAAYGKRTRLDNALNRDFIKGHSPYVGIKYHAKIPLYDNELISLHNFPGGYCGICKVENDIANICYLVHRDRVREAGSIKDLEKNVLKQNPKLKEVMGQANSLFEKPVVVNEINFHEKSPNEGNIFMLGDAAGMIAPLCGNGMAMAVHSAKMAAEIILSNKGATTVDLINIYSREWRRNFSKRLMVGRFLQKTLFGKSWSSELAVFLSQNMPLLAQNLISRTHGSKIH